MQDDGQEQQPLHIRLKSGLERTENSDDSAFSSRVVDPYSFFTDPDPDPELDVGGQYGSGSNTDPGL